MKTSFSGKFFGLTPVSHTLSRIASPLMHGKKALWAQLSFRWQEIAGPFAKRTRPERLFLPTDKQSIGVLHLAVWGGDCMELSYDAARLCEKINQYFGFAAVHQIKWRITRDPPNKTKIQTPHPVVLSAAQQDWLAINVRGVDEGSLQDSLKRFGEALLQQEKK